MDLNKLVGDTNPEDLKKIIAILQAVVGLKDSDNEPETNDTKKSNIKTKSREKVFLAIKKS